MMQDSQSTGFGLAPIKVEGWCYSYDHMVSFDPLDSDFEEFYKDSGRKYIPKSTYLKVWRSALESNAKKAK